MGLPIIVQRSTKPERILEIPQKNDEPTFSITGWAFRYNVMIPFEDKPEAQEPIFSLVPVISSAVNRLVKVTFTVAETGITVGRYPGVLQWRKDGTDPTSDVVPDDFDDIEFEVVEKILASP